MRSDRYSIRHGYGGFGAAANKGPVVVHGTVTKPPQNYTKLGNVGEVRRRALPRGLKEDPLESDAAGQCAN